MKFKKLESRNKFKIDKIISKTKIKYKQITIFFIILLFNFLILILNLNKSNAQIIENQKAKITISNIESNVKVKIYKLSSAYYDYDNDCPMDNPYSWDNNLISYIQSYNDTYLDIEQFYNQYANNNNQIIDFYNMLSNTIIENNIDLENYEQITSGTQTYPIDSSNLNSSVIFDNLNMGSYLILIENGYMIYNPIVVNLIPQFNENTNTWELNDIDNINIKATNITINKTIGEDKIDQACGTDDVISFKIKAIKPNFDEYSNSKTYIIEDRIEKYLLLDKTSLRICATKNNATPIELEENIDYTIDIYDNPNLPDGEDENISSMFIIDFNYDNLSDYDSTIITYDAKLDTNCNIISDSSNNVCKLIYSNNPYDSGSRAEQESRINHIYTYKIEIQNKDKKTNNNLSGSIFELYKDDKKINFIQIDGIYYPTNEDIEDKVNVLNTTSDGKINIIGLSLGSYILKEIKQPDDYKLIYNDIEINLNDDDIDGVLNDDEDNILNIDVFHIKHIDLPDSGAVFKIAYKVVGFVLIIIGIIIIRSKNKEK